MKITILDLYPNISARISKDTNGGYGTVNRYGKGLIPRLLTRVKAKSVDWPPLSSIYTFAVLKQAGIEVNFIKTKIDQFDPQQVAGSDLCLVTSSIVAHETELQGVTQVKQLGVPVGVTGPFATSQPDAYLQQGAFVISGEPEFFFLNKSLDEISELKQASGVVQSAGSNTNLDDLPFPAWEEICKTNQPRYNLLGSGELFLPIVATRGCPYSCYHYCTYPLQQGRKVRMRSAENILAEMSHWQDTLGVSLFMFRDPVFSIHRKHTVEICNALIESGRQFRFIIETHLKNIDDELAHLLKKAGLVMVKTGVESADEDVLASSNRFSIDKNDEMSRVKMLQDMGIKVTCFYIFGMPTDTEESCNKTIQFARNMDSYAAQFTIFTPYPGTPAFAEFKDKITAQKMEDFTQCNSVIKHDNLSAEKTQQILGKAYTRYYTDPHWMWKFIKSRLAA